MRALFAALTVTVLYLASALPAQAKVNIFACEPEWAALSDALGGDKVSVYQATSPLQDPHRVEARPSLIARMRTADMMVCNGAELEVAWLPVLIQASGNRAVQPGQPGHFLAADQVPRLEVPTEVDRSMGDVHPFGNPHVHLDPRRLAKIAEALTRRLAQIDAGNADYYAARGSGFQTRWREAIARWEKAAEPLKGLRVVTYHRDSIYLIDWLGLKMAVTIEPKPGIPPSAGHLSALLTQLKAEPADLILRMAYNEPKAPQWLGERTGLPVAVLPFTVGGTREASDLIGLFGDTIARLKQAAGRQ